MTNNLLKHDIEEFGVFSDESFDFEYSMEFASETLGSISLENTLNECDIKLSKWSILDEVTQSRINFDFKKTIELSRFQKNIDSEYFVSLVKSWIAYNLTIMHTKTCGAILNAFNLFLEISYCFEMNEKLLPEITEKITNLNKYSQLILSKSVLNFLDYYSGDLDENGFYTKLLCEIKADLEREVNVRDIPTPRDVVIYSKIFDDFFSKIESNTPDYFIYFPIYLWWNFTNIIPIRPSEFTGIKRDGFEKKKNGEYYLTIARRKKGSNGERIKKFNKNRIQIIDTIRIPRELGLKIEEYVDLSERFGTTETLLSYPAWEQNINIKRGKRKKLVGEIYTLLIFQKQLQNFHKDIVEGKYGYNINPNKEEFNNGSLSGIVEKSYDLSRMLRPGDTRHFAFLNLMRQGFHPIEIARLGGHTELRSQYHYHNHQKFLLDTEILKLMSKFKFEKNVESDNKTVVTHSVSGIETITNKEFMQKFVFRPIVGTQRTKLEDGFCIHPYQHCPVDDCMFCEYWRIDLDEFNLKREKIKNKYMEVYDQTKSLIDSLLDIHKYIIESHSNDLTFISDENFQMNKDLLVASKKLEESIHNLSKIGAIEGNTIESYE